MSGIGVGASGRSVAEFWMNWQAAYDLQSARKKHGKEYTKIKTVPQKAA